MQSTGRSARLEFDCLLCEFLVLHKEVYKNTFLYAAAGCEPGTAVNPSSTCQLPVQMALNAPDSTLLNLVSFTIIFMQMVCVNLYLNFFLIHPIQSFGTDVIYPFFIRKFPLFRGKKDSETYILIETVYFTGGEIE